MLLKYYLVGLLRNPVKGKIKMLCTTAVCVIPNSGDIISQQQLIKNRDGQHQKGEEKRSCRWRTNSPIRNRAGHPANTHNFRSKKPVK